MMSLMYFSLGALTGSLLSLASGWLGYHRAVRRARRNA